MAMLVPEGRHEVTTEGGLDVVAGESRLADAVGRLTRPVIAAVHGDAVAEGLELALACDLRLVSTDAHLSMPQLLHGRLPSHGGTQRLPRIVGRMRALDLLLTGRSLAASEAEAIGLASRVAAPAVFGAALEALVGTLQSKGPLALRYAKEAVLKGSDLTLDQGSRLEEDLYVLLQTTQDRREGIDAFLTKRKPVFTGQ
jgi:enoyl-CoA hydratase